MNARFGTLLTCDKCGATKFGRALSVRETISNAVQWDGWSHGDAPDLFGATDLCPACAGGKQ